MILRPSPLDVRKGRSRSCTRRLLFDSELDRHHDPRGHRAPETQLYNRSIRQEPLRAATKGPRPTTSDAAHGSGHVASSISLSRIEARPVEVVSGLVVGPVQWEGQQIMEIAPGSMLASRYRLVRMLGRGGMADVYEAADMRLDRSVAVKVFRQQTELSGNEARQQREIQVLARLQHPNIVSVFDAGTEGELSFVVMQLIDGVTL